jgi:hypothetical protein
MVGTIACENCALLKNEWQCLKPGGGFVDGHIPAVNQPESRDFDSWSHPRRHGMHVAMVIETPWSGLLQGAEEYLHYTARRPASIPTLREGSRSCSTHGTRRPRILTRAPIHETRPWRLSRPDRLYRLPRRHG